jgi:hypothetical protein
LEKLIFQSGNNSEMSAIYTQVFNSQLTGLKDSTGTALGGMTVNNLLVKLLGGTGVNLSTTVQSDLQNLYKGYDDKIKVYSLVFQVNYDTLGRITGTSENRTWGQVGGGNLPGLDSGWRNGNVVVTTQLAYLGSSNQVSEQSVRALGSGVNDDPALNHGIDLGYIQTNLTYDTCGREVSSWTFTDQWTKYDYLYLENEANGTRRDEHNNSGIVSRVATITYSEVKQFDGYGRPSTIYSYFCKSDGDNTEGTDTTSNIVYNPDGTRMSAYTDTTSIMHEHVNNDALGCEAPIGSVWLDYWSGLGLVQNTTLAQEYQNMRRTENAKVIHSYGTQWYCYDAYGNIDNQATQNQSNITNDVGKADGAGLTGLGQFLDINFAAMKIVGSILACTGNVILMAVGAALVGIGTWLSNAIHGANNQDNWKATLISVGTTLANAGAASAIKDAIGVAQTVSQIIAQTAMQAAAYAAITVVSATAQGIKSNAELDQAVESSLLSGAAGSIDSSTLNIVGKLVLVTAINVGAAAAAGVTDGRQLLLVAAFSLASSIVTANSTGSQGTAAHAEYGRDWASICFGIGRRGCSEVTRPSGHGVLQPSGCGLDDAIGGWNSQQGGG